MTQGSARPPGEVLYISGPMTGMPGHNREAFAKAAAHYRSRGYEVINPAELDGPGDPGPWEDCIRRDLVALASSATKIVALPGWAASKGARLEVHVAMQLGMGFTSYYPQEEQEWL